MKKPGRGIKQSKFGKISRNTSSCLQITAQKKPEQKNNIRWVEGGSEAWWGGVVVLRAESPPSYVAPLLLTRPRVVK